MDNLNSVNILSLVGQQGSGKTTLGALLSKALYAQNIEASNVVKILHGNLTRSEMPSTNVKTKDDPGWLGRAIAKEINWYRVVLTGVREEEVHTTLRKMGAQVLVIELWTPQNERFARVRDAGKVDEYSDFLKHDASELDIGLKLMLDKYAFFITSYHSPEETTQNILEYIHTTESAFCD